MGVIGEVDGSLGLALWRGLRDAHAWTEMPSEQRARYFGDDDGPLPRSLSYPASKDDPAEGDWIGERTASAIQQAPELSGALGLLALVPRAPELVDGKQIAEACHSVYEWADLRGMVRTGQLFAEMAAHADPENPARANYAARMCRRAALFPRAADWYQRGLGLAVSQENRKEAIYALLGCGTLHRDLGQYDQAHRAFVRAARKASRKNHRREAAEARHDLLGLAAEMGRFDDADAEAIEAINLYPRKHPRLPALANDYCYTLIRRAHYAPALTLLESTVPLIARPEERALVWSTLGWAAAGMGRRDRYSAAEHEVLTLIAVHADYAHAALIHLAEGARLLGEWEAAGRYAERAAEGARRRHDAPLAREAEALGAALAAREPGLPHMPAGDTIEILARRIIVRLRQWKAPERVPSPSTPAAGG
jgi:tetratricopeptide (TPR) repeat protein